ncbi:uncharacterized protein EDB91DRAFT_212494 [Suillus paluster]|uniref:uncharacterized protein n=1 Tax=Suillus paluster TaxID=48578 RepID=UPI001B8642A2|nr:uncharacterized protein EDB91DRAFT_212494 [Suillus paluster]KAG1744151.1 hypothetical protein EDB91DRAFT_212494 [Suillus paluster]
MSRWLSILYIVPTSCILLGAAPVSTTNIIYHVTRQSNDYSPFGLILDVLQDYVSAFPSQLTFSIMLTMLFPMDCVL